MNRYLVAIYRDDEYSLDIYINHRQPRDRHAITEAVKVVLGDTDLESHKRTRYVQKLLLADADPNGKDGDGSPFIVSAVEKQEMELVNLLINFECDVNEANEDGLTAMHAAAKAGSAELAGLLLSSGASVNTGDSYGETPLMRSLYFEPSEDLFNILLIDANINAANSDRETALHIAVHMNLVKEASVLIENGADVNVKDIHGNTPLHCASHHKKPNPDMVQLLIDAQCDVNAQTHHLVTPLHLLSANSSATKALEVLLKCGDLSLDPVTDTNQTPLFAAVHNQAFDNVKFLLQANCDVSFKGISVGSIGKRCSLLDVAVKQVNPRLIEMLLLAGCEANGLLTQIERLFSQLSIGNVSDERSLLLVRPFSLKQLCRLQIRQAIGKQVGMKVENLPLPHQMREYVSLSELDSI